MSSRMQCYIVHLTFKTIGRLCKNISSFNCKKYNTVICRIEVIYYDKIYLKTEMGSPFHMLLL